MASPLADLTTSVVQTLVLYSLAEHQLGHAKSIQVTASDRSFSIEDDGRGHPLDRVVEGAPYLDFIYCHLDTPVQGGQSKPVQLQGLGMSLLNRLCSEMVVTVRKREATLVLRFKDGVLAQHELSEPKGEGTGNKISGSVHPDFGLRPLDERALERWLHALHEASPALQLRFNGRPLRRLATGA